MNLWEKLDKAEVNTTNFSILPEGYYTAEVTNIEMKDDELMKELVAELTILDGDHVGRKCWWQTRLDDNTSEKKMTFIKGQICTAAGVSTTNGDPMGVFSSIKGNTLKIQIKHSPGIKDPTKTYTNVFFQDMIAPI